LKKVTVAVPRFLASRIRHEVIDSSEEVQQLEGTEANTTIETGSDKYDI